METVQNPVPQMEQPKPKNNRNLIIGIVVAVILCCCCVAVGVGGYYAYQSYLAAQQAVQDLQNIEIPDIPTDVPFNPADPNSTLEVPEFDFSGQAPTGGLADDDTRYTAWLSVQIVGAISGCSAPTVDGTTIAVLEQPDANGVWVEEWNVNCGDGTSQPFKVTFTPENGIVNVNVEVPQ